MPDDPNQPNPAAPAEPVKPTGTQPGPIKVADPSKEGGFQYFNTPEELAAAKEETNKFAWQLKQEVDALRKEQERFRTGIQQVVAPATTTGQPQFDSNRYYQLLAEDPVGAQRYALQFTPEFQELRTNAQKSRLLNVTQMFLSENPGFEPTDENVKVLLNTAAELGADERTVTPRVLRAAYNDAVAQGKIKPATTTTTAQTTTTQQNPPPVLPTTTTLTVSQADDLATKIANARSKTEMDEILRQAGVQPPPT